MIYQFVILLALLGNFVQEPAPASGIYIIHETPRGTKCTNEHRMVVGRLKICLSPKPILENTVLRPASAVQYDPLYKTHYIAMGITSEGSRILLQTKKSLPDSKFALVVDGDIICVFTINNDYAIKSFRIGEDVALADLMIIHEKLEQADL
ncbi:MAG: hypothetical protein ABI477_22870 [Chryseolinea sp.]